MTAITTDQHTLHRILVAAPLSADGLAILQRHDGVQVEVVAQTLDSLTPHLPDADVLIVGDELTVDKSLMDSAPCLKVIGRVGADLTTVDVDEATRRGIIVMNVPGVDAVTVAEYTFTLILALVRGMMDAHHDLLDGNWNRDLYVGNQLKGKTLGILGFGHVGREIASRAIAFGLDVLVSDPYVPESQVAGMRLKLVGLDELLSRSDIITLHTAVVGNTKHLIHAETLAQTKRGVFIVNVKHHSLIHAHDLLAALESGQVAGAAIDDFETVALKDNPLIGHQHVIHTQRMRFNTVEARHDLSTTLARQVLDALRQQDYRNAVNMPFMAGSEYENIAAQLHTAEKIGFLHHHLGHQAAIERVEISIRGEEMQGRIKPLTVAILRGLLAPRLGKSVNYINAPVIANERGIFVTQRKKIAIDSYPNLLASRVLWSDGFELTVAGAIFNQTEPRIVQVDHYRTDFSPQGALLFMGSYDVPGVIGHVGTFMADHRINIAGWRTSRVEKGGQTLSVISVDEPLTDSLLEELRGQEFVRHATQVTFPDDE